MTNLMQELEDVVDALEANSSGVQDEAIVARPTKKQRRTKAVRTSGSTLRVHLHLRKAASSQPNHHLCGCWVGALLRLC